MLFHPAKVPLKIFSISFKVHSVSCDRDPSNLAIVPGQYTLVFLKTVAISVTWQSCNPYIGVIFLHLGISCEKYAFRA